MGGVWTLTLNPVRGCRCDGPNAAPTLGVCRAIPGECRDIGTPACSVLGISDLGSSSWLGVKSGEDSALASSSAVLLEAAASVDPSPSAKHALTPAVDSASAATARLFIGLGDVCRLASRTKVDSDSVQKGIPLRVCSTPLGRSTPGYGEADRESSVHLAVHKEGDCDELDLPTVFRPANDKSAKSRIEDPVCVESFAEASTGSPDIAP